MSIFAGSSVLYFAAMFIGSVLFGVETLMEHGIPHTADGQFAILYFLVAIFAVAWVGGMVGDVVFYYNRWLGHGLLLGSRLLLFWFFYCLCVMVLVPIDFTLSATAELFFLVLAPTAWFLPLARPSVLLLATSVPLLVTLLVTIILNLPYLFKKG